MTVARIRRFAASGSPGCAVLTRATQVGGSGQGAAHRFRQRHRPATGAIDPHHHHVPVRVQRGAIAADDAVADGDAGVAHLFREQFHRDVGRVGNRHPVIQLDGRQQRRDGVVDPFALPAFEPADARFLQVSEEVGIVDVLEQPDVAERLKILATPMLVKELPPPTRRIIGDLSNAQQVMTWIEPGLLHDEAAGTT